MLQKDIKNISQEKNIRKKERREEEEEQEESKGQSQPKV